MNQTFAFVESDIQRLPVPPGQFSWVALNFPLEIPRTPVQNSLEIPRTLVENSLVFPWIISEIPLLY